MLFGKIVRYLLLVSFELLFLWMLVSYALALYELNILNTKFFPLLSEIFLLLAIHGARDMLFTQLINRPLLDRQLSGLFCQNFHALDVVSLFLESLAWE